MTGLHGPSPLTFTQARYNACRFRSQGGNLAYNGEVQVRGYFFRVALEAGLMLACALPCVLIAAWHSRTRRWGLLLLVASLVVLDVALVEIPRVDGFRHLHWNWQACLLSTAWPFLLIALVPGISLVSIGVTLRFRPGWLKPSIVGLLLALAVPAVFFILGLVRDWTLRAGPSS